MKEILANMALFHLTDFGKEHGVNISGSHLEKVGRGFKYSLVNDDTGDVVMFITFHKTSVPTYSVNPNYEIV